MRRAIVFGGAGFVGSNVARDLVREGWEVAVVDGLLPRTTGSRDNLTRLGLAIDVTIARVEALSDIVERVARADLVVDAMGWTRHLDAAKDPAYDLALNVGAHLPLIAACRSARPKLVISLGSRHQYGRSTDATITEDTPQHPVDVQGIHKAAAEHHWRIAAQAGDFAVATLRFGNTFGPNQPIGTGDIGLIGGFIRDLIVKGRVSVYGGPRRRNLLFAPDLAAIIEQLGRTDLLGFEAFNVAGVDCDIADLARRIAGAVGRGDVIEQPMPPEIAAIEVGEARFVGTKLASFLGGVALTPLDDAIRATVDDVRRRLAPETGEAGAYSSSAR